MNFSYKFDPHRPIPYALSQWDTGTEILYKCAKCGCDFRILSHQENYCHQCGLKLDWTRSPRYCSPEFKKRYDELVYEHHAIFGRGATDEGNEYDKELFELLRDLYFGVTQ